MNTLTMKRRSTCVSINTSVSTERARRVANKKLKCSLSNDEEQDSKLFNDTCLRSTARRKALSTCTKTILRSKFRKSPNSSVKDTTSNRESYRNVTSNNLRKHSRNLVTTKNSNSPSSTCKVSQPQSISDCKTALFIKSSKITDKEMLLRRSTRQASRERRVWSKARLPTSQIPSKDVGTKKIKTNDLVAKKNSKSNQLAVLAVPLEKKRKVGRPPKINKIIQKKNSIGKTLHDSNENDSALTESTREQRSVTQTRMRLRYASKNVNVLKVKTELPCEGISNDAVSNVDVDEDELGTHITVNKPKSSNILLKETISDCDFKYSPVKIDSETKKECNSQQVASDVCSDFVGSSVEQVDDNKDLYSFIISESKNKEQNKFDNDVLLTSRIIRESLQQSSSLAKAITPFSCQQIGTKSVFPTKVASGILSRNVNKSKGSHSLIARTKLQTAMMNRSSGSNFLKNRRKEQIKSLSMSADGVQFNNTDASVTNSPMEKFQENLVDHRNVTTEAKSSKYVNNTLPKSNNAKLSCSTRLLLDNKLTSRNLYNMKIDPASTLLKKFKLKKSKNNLSLKNKPERNISNMKIDRKHEEDVISVKRDLDKDVLSNIKLEKFPGSSTTLVNKKNGHKINSIPENLLKILPDNQVGENKNTVKGEHCFNVTFEGPVDYIPELPIATTISKLKARVQSKSAATSDAEFQRLNKLKTGNQSAHEIYQEKRDLQLEPGSIMKKFKSSMASKLSSGTSMDTVDVPQNPCATSSSNSISFSSCTTRSSCNISTCSSPLQYINTAASNFLIDSGITPVIPRSSAATCISVHSSDSSRPVMSSAIISSSSSTVSSLNNLVAQTPAEMSPDGEVSLYAALAQLVEADASELDVKQTLTIHPSHKLSDDEIIDANEESSGRSLIQLCHAATSVEAQNSQHLLVSKNEPKIMPVDATKAKETENSCTQLSKAVERYCETSTHVLDVKKIDKVNGSVILLPCNKVMAQDTKGTVSVQAKALDHQCSDAASEEKEDIFQNTFVLQARKQVPPLIKVSHRPLAIKTPLKCPECPMQFCTVRSLLWHFGIHAEAPHTSLNLSPNPCLVPMPILLQGLQMAWSELPSNIYNGEEKPEAQNGKPSQPGQKWGVFEQAGKDPSGTHLKEYCIAALTKESGFHDENATKHVSEQNIIKRKMLIRESVSPKEECIMNELKPVSKISKQRLGDMCSDVSIIEEFQRCTTSAEHNINISRGSNSNRLFMSKDSVDLEKTAKSFLVVESPKTSTGCGDTNFSDQTISCNKAKLGGNKSVMKSASDVKLCYESLPLPPARRKRDHSKLQTKHLSRKRKTNREETSTSHFITHNTPIVATSTGVVATVIGNHTIETKQHQQPHIGTIDATSVQRKSHITGKFKNEKNDVILKIPIPRLKNVPSHDSQLAPPKAKEITKFVNIRPKVYPILTSNTPPKPILSNSSAIQVSTSSHTSNSNSPFALTKMGAHDTTSSSAAPKASFVVSKASGRAVTACSQQLSRDDLSPGKQQSSSHSFSNFHRNLRHNVPSIGPHFKNVALVHSVDTSKCVMVSKDDGTRSSIAACHNVSITKSIAPVSCTIATKGAASGENLTLGKALSLASLSIKPADASNRSSCSSVSTTARNATSLLTESSLKDEAWLKSSTASGSSSSHLSQPSSLSGSSFSIATVKTNLSQNFSSSEYLESDGIVMINPSLGLRIVSTNSNRGSTSTVNTMDSKPIMSSIASDANCLTLIPDSGDNSLTIVPQLGCSVNSKRMHASPRTPDILTIVPQVDPSKALVRSIPDSRSATQIMTAAGKLSPSQAVKLVLVQPDKTRQNSLPVSASLSSVVSRKQDSFCQASLVKNHTSKFSALEMSCSQNITSDLSKVTCGTSTRQQPSKESLAVMKLKQRKLSYSDFDEDVDSDDGAMVIDTEKGTDEEQQQQQHQREVTMDPMAVCSVSLEDAAVAEAGLQLPSPPTLAAHTPSSHSARDTAKSHQILSESRQNMLIVGHSHLAESDKSKELDDIGTHSNSTKMKVAHLSATAANNSSESLQLLQKPACGQDLSSIKFLPTSSISLLPGSTSESGAVGIPSTFAAISSAPSTTLPLSSCTVSPLEQEAGVSLFSNASNSVIPAYTAGLTPAGSLSYGTTSVVPLNTSQCIPLMSGGMNPISSGASSPLVSSCGSFVPNANISLIPGSVPLKYEYDSNRVSLTSSNVIPLVTTSNIPLLKTTNVSLVSGGSVTSGPLSSSSPGTGYPLLLVASAGEHLSTSATIANTLTFPVITNEKVTGNDASNVDTPVCNSKPTSCGEHSSKAAVIAAADVGSSWSLEITSDSPSEVSSKSKPPQLDPEQYQQRKYVCTYCHRRFGWSTDLKRHVILHTGEKPFKCEICFTAFTRKFLLQNHMKKMHVDKCDNSDL